MQEELSSVLNDTLITAEERCNSCGNLHSALIYTKRIHCDWCDLKWKWIVLIENGIQNPFGGGN